MLRFLKSHVGIFTEPANPPSDWSCRFAYGCVPCPAQAPTEPEAMQEFAKYLREIADEVDAEAAKIT